MEIWDIRIFVILILIDKVMNLRILIFFVVSICASLLNALDYTNQNNYKNFIGNFSIYFRYCNKECPFRSTKALSKKAKNVNKYHLIKPNKLMYLSNGYK